jgi:hypothetical protein
MQASFLVYQKGAAGGKLGGLTFSRNSFECREFYVKHEKSKSSLHLLEKVL